MERKNAVQVFLKAWTPGGEPQSTPEPDLQLEVDLPWPGCRNKRGLTALHTHTVVPTHLQSWLGCHTRTQLFIASGFWKSELKEGQP